VGRTFYTGAASQILQTSEGAELLSGALSGSLSTNQDNYAPPGIAEASVLLLQAANPINISGLSGGLTLGSSVRELTVVNLSATAQAITLLANSGLSLPANAFNFPANLVLQQFAAARLLYLGAPLGWLHVT
jgi:hypothetical protein